MKQFILSLSVLLFASSASAQIYSDPMLWRDDSKVLVALEKPRMHYQIQKKEPNIVLGEVTVETCVEWNGECKPSNAFYSVITSEDL